MKILLVISTALSILTASAQRKELHNKAGIPFERLSGNWVYIKKDGVTMGEIWQLKNEHAMTGKSFMIKNGDTTILETVDLVEEGNDIFYIPVAYGQNDDLPVRFELTSVRGSMYLFENPEHDFPKRIVYDFTGSTTLHAYIDDGTMNKRQHYYYKKQD